MSAQEQIADDRNVLERADAVTACRALRSRNEKVVARRRYRTLCRLAGKLRALFPPPPFEHSRKAVDDDVQEAADAQPEDGDDDEHGHELDGHGLAKKGRSQ